MLRREQIAKRFTVLEELDVLHPPAAFIWEGHINMKRAIFLAHDRDGHYVLRASPATLQGLLEQDLGLVGHDLIAPETPLDPAGGAGQDVARIDVAVQRVLPLDAAHLPFGRKHFNTGRLPLEENPVGQQLRREIGVIGRRGRGNPVQCYIGPLSRHAGQQEKRQKKEKRAFHTE